MTGRIYLVAGVTVAALALLFTALAVATVSARDGLRVIGHDAGPQVVATADLYFALRQPALDRYGQRRAEAGRALLQASDLAGDDPVERRTAQDLLDGLGRYERLAARALLLGEQADDPAGPPPPEALDAYRQATDLMSQELLPQAYNLTLESGTIVRRTHDTTRATVAAGRVVVGLVGVLTLGCLIWLQVFLARRFHRRLNSALLLATAITALYAFTGVAVLGKESSALRTAKSDGFDTVLSLARARAISNSLYADQSRYLLDPDRADTYEQVYLDKSLSLLYLDDVGNLATYYDTLSALAGGRQSTPGAVVGLLGEVASGDVLDTYDQFQRADRELRDLARGGDTGGAVAAWLETSRSRFEAYDIAVIDRADAHRDVFDRAVARGEDAIDGLEFLLPVTMLVIAVLVVAGIVPRLREYR